MDIVNSNRILLNKKFHSQRVLDADSIDFKEIDNHGGSYLGMARCFNVHR